MTDLDKSIRLAGECAVLAYQLRELLAVIDGSDSLDEIRARAELARRALEQTEGSEGSCK